MFAKLGSSTIWFMIPTLVIAIMVGLVISNYNPLMFDPSLIETAQAAQNDQMGRLKNLDAAEESEKNGNPVALGGGTPAPADAVQTVGAAPVDGLADGTWTGYAPCGQGNADGWKPYYVAVTIQVENGRVKRITDISGSSTADSGASLSWDPAENQTYLTWAASGRNGSTGVQTQINSALTSGNSISGVDAVSGATYSSAAVYNAYVAAVNKAASAGGATTTNQSTQNPVNPSSSSSAKPGERTESTKKAKDDSGEEVANKKLADGSWTGYAPCGEGNDEEWSPYYVGVTISVKKGVFVRITNVFGTSRGEKGDPVLNWKKSENEAYLNWAAKGRTRSSIAYEGVVPQLESAMSTAYPSEIDVVSGATYSSEALFRAFYAALKKSAEAGGTTVEEPDDPNGSNGKTDPSKSSSSSSSSSSTDPGESEKPSNSSKADDEDDPQNPEEKDGPGTPDDKDDPGTPDEKDDPEEPTVKLVDGVYTGHAFCEDQDDPRAWSAYYLLMDVEVVNGKVARVFNARADSTGEIDPRYIYDSSQNATYLNFAINGIGKRILGMIAKMQEKLDIGSDPTVVDVVSSATWSSKAIVEAYKNALANIPTASESS